MTTIDTTVDVRVAESVGRATPEPAERAFRDALRDGAGVLLDGVERAAGSLPGGAVVSAATSALTSVGGGGSASWGAGSSEADGGSSMDDALSRSAMQQMELLELQQRMQDENQRFTTLSNVLKAEHETAKTAIGNIR
jgi:hypothetical protein